MEHIKYVNLHSRALYTGTYLGIMLLKMNLRYSELESYVIYTHILCY